MKLGARRFVTALGLAALSVGGAQAFPFPLEAAVGTEVQSWNLSGGDGRAQIEQVVTPVWIHALPARSLEVWFYAGSAWSTLSRRADGDLRSLETFTASFDWQPGPRGLHVLAGAAIGVDSPSFSEGDRILATLLAEPVLGWAVPVHGRGADVRLGALYAVPAPKGSATWGILWSRRGSYVTGMGKEFDPADEVRISTAYQLRVQDLLGHLNLSWTSGGESRLEDRKIFETDARWDVSLMGEISRGPMRFTGAIGMRGYSTADLEPLPGAIQGVDPANLWTLTLGAERPWRRWAGRFVVHYVSSPDAPTGRNGGFTWRLEAGVTRSIGRWGAVSLDGGPSWGELDNGGATQGWRGRLLLIVRPAGSSSPSESG